MLKIADRNRTFNLGPQRAVLPEETPLSPQKLEEGVYTASSYSENGEKIYLRMERITEKNHTAWNQYEQRKTTGTGIPKFSWGIAVMDRKNRR